MRTFKRMLPMLMVLALCLALLPAAAQNGLSGAWQADGAFGSVTMILGETGSYISFSPTLQVVTDATAGLWQGDGMTLDAGVYSVQGMYLSVTNQGGITTWWRYGMTGNMLYLYHEPTGVYFNLIRVNPLVPAGMGGEWKDPNGALNVTIRDDSSFIQANSDGTIDLGVWMADSNFLTLSYDDGEAYLFRYKLEPSSLKLYDLQMQEVLGALVRPESQMTPVPLVTQVPTFPVGTPLPEATEAPPAPEWLTEATSEPVPESTEPAPEWLTEATSEPVPESTEPAPEWLTEATSEPVTESTEPAPEWLTEATSEPLQEVTDSLSEETTPVSEVSVAAPGLAGAWRGKDAIGSRLILFTLEGLVETSYEEAESDTHMKKGSFVSENDMITITYEDGSVETFRYILMGNNLLLSDENLQNPVTFTREPAED